MRKVTYKMMANDINLWMEYAAPQGQQELEEIYFSETEEVDRIKLLIETFGTETTNDEE
jgi:hypothetical protein